MNGCKYIIYTSGSADFNCPEGKSVVMTSGTCEVTIHAQKGLSKFDLSTNGTDISVQATVVKAINYTVTKDGFGCPFNGTGAKTEGSYTQQNPVTVTGNGGRTVSIS